MKLDEYSEVEGWRESADKNLGSDTMGYIGLNK
jgi:hypothetical protein